MDLNQMAIFAKVVERSSFTKAAKDLGMEKSNVSQKISKLESRLGVRLLNRTTRSVTMTEAGAGYYEFCAEIMDKVIEADHFAESLNAEPKGTITLTAPSNLGPLITKSLIIPFMQKHKQIMISLNLTNRKVDLVKEGYDLAIRGDLTPPKDSSDIYRELTRSQSGLYSTKEYLEASGEPANLDDLASHEMIIFTPEEDFKKKVSIKANFNNKVVKLTPNYRIKVNDITACMEFAVSGQGIALLPELLVQNYLTSGKLIPVLPGLVFPEARIFAVYASSRLKSAKIKVFLDWLISSRFLSLD